MEHLRVYMVKPLTFLNAYIMPRHLLCYGVIVVSIRVSLLHMVHSLSWGLALWLHGECSLMSSLSGDDQSILPLSR